MIVASSPGKLVLTGEYAVLTGAPAVVVAIGRRARVSLAPATSCSVEAAGLPAPATAFAYSPDGAIEWSSAAGEDYRLLAVALKTLAAGRTLPVGRDFHATLDTTAFYDGRQKLGLGSSAALTTALTGALCSHFGLEWGPEFAYEAHRLLQGGKGSGVDVAAALVGGLIRFRSDGRLPEVVRLPWPRSLAVGFIWTGRSAATSSRVERFLQWVGTADGAACASRLSDAALAAADSWSSGDIDALLAATSNYAGRLREVADGSGVDIFGGGHDELSRLADTAGVVYKPSGAGGGDLGMALSRDAERLRAFRAEAVRAGYTALDLRPDEQGFRIEL